MARRRRRAPGKRTARRPNRPRQKRLESAGSPEAPLAAAPPPKPTPVRAKLRLPHPPRPTPAALVARPRTASRAGLWQVHVCVALCAFASAAGILLVVGEMDMQFAGTRGAVVCVGLALSLGVALGLLIPRRIIRGRIGAAPLGLQRAAADGPVRESARSGDIDQEFVASLTGLLIVTLAVVWCLLGGLMAGMESYRAILTQRFFHPPWLTLSLLALPAVCGLTLLGGVSAMLLVALHGWQRLASRSRAGVALWLALLAGALAGALFARVHDRSGPLVLATLLASFTAGILAVLRKPAGLAQADSQPAPTFGPRAFWAELLVVASASASFGAALTLSARPGPSMGPDLATGLLIACGSAVAGILLAKLAPRAILGGANSATFVLLGIALVWGLAGRVGPLAELAQSAPRVALMGVLATVCIALVGTRVARTLKRTPPAMARVGVASAAGFAAGLLAAAIGLSGYSATGMAVVISLALAAIAGVLLVFQRRTRWLPSAAGFAAIALLLALVLTDSQPLASQAARPERPAAVRAGRQLLNTPGSRTMFATAAGDDQSSALAIDLGGPRCDVVVLTADRAATRPVKPARMRRVLARARGALLTGGRLAIELRDEGLREATLGPDAIKYDLPRTEYLLLTVSDGGDEYAALVIGPDATAWLRPQPVAAGCEAHLRPVQGRAGLLRALESPPPTAAPYP